MEYVSTESSECHYLTIDSVFSEQVMCVAQFKVNSGDICSGSKIQF